MWHRDVRLIIYAALLILVETLPIACARQDVTVTISGDEQAEGATVVVNGRSVGSMQKTVGSAVGFTRDFSPGTWTIEVKKEGYRPFHEIITLTSNEREYHVYAKLAQKVPLTTDTQTGAIPDQPTAPPASKPANSGVPVCPD